MSTNIYSHPISTRKTLVEHTALLQDDVGILLLFAGSDDGISLPSPVIVGKTFLMGNGCLRLVFRKDSAVFVPNADLSSVALAPLH